MDNGMIWNQPYKIRIMHSRSVICPSQSLAGQPGGGGNDTAVLLVEGNNKRHIQVSRK